MDSQADSEKTALTNQVQGHGKVDIDRDDSAGYALREAL
jgi:hypothetical protein